LTLLKPKGVTKSNYDARKLLVHLSSKVRNETDFDALSDELVAVVREPMQPACASLGGLA
jgi:hypothetical protein